MFLKRAWLACCVALFVSSAVSCSDPGIVQGDAGAALDAQRDGGKARDGVKPRDSGKPDRKAKGDGPPQDAATKVDAKFPPDSTADLPPTVPLPRGLKWVRNNPMFISGLTVSMGAPTAAAVSDYFSSFKANAVHLWETGLPTELAGWRKYGGASTRFLSWVYKNGKSLSGGKVIGGLAANTPGRIGYQISDEPRTMVHFNEMVAGAKVVRKADPAALLVFNFTYQLTQLDQALAQSGASEMDVYSYDIYTRSNGSYEHLARYREVGLKYKRPYWRYIRGYLPSTSGKDALSESDARWDAFSGAVYGYTGHSWFLYQVQAGHKLQPAFFAKPGSFTSTKTAAFAIAAKINTELKHLGRALTQLTSTDVRYNPSIAFVQPKKTQKFTPGAGGDPFITKISGKGGAAVDYLVGFFRDPVGEQVVMLQNVKHTHGDFPVSLLVGPVTFQVDFDFKSGKAAKTKVLSIDKKTGAQVVLPLTSLGGSKARLNLTLAAGDPVLFKYSTGKPFILGK